MATIRRRCRMACCQQMQNAERTTQSDKKDINCADNLIAPPFAIGDTMYRVNKYGKNKYGVSPIVVKAITYMGDGKWGAYEMLNYVYGKDLFKSQGEAVEEIERRLGLHTYK